MVNYSQKFQSLRLSKKLYLLFLLCFMCPKIWASQIGMVIADRAIIYADREMTSPLGFVARGKKVKIGEIPRNKAQVYPIVISGKLAYIRVIDVTTEKESMDATRLTAERFQQQTIQEHKSKLALSYYSFLSQIALDESNSTLKDGDALQWHGLSLKGELKVWESWDILVLLNFMQAEKDQETFRVLEFGFGGAYRLIDARRFKLRLEALGMAIPFSSYALGDDFRVNGYGFTAGGGVSASLYLGEHWALEGNFGPYYSKVFGYDAPEPYKSINPSFTGVRAGAGLSYTY